MVDNGIFRDGGKHVGRVTLEKWLLGLLSQTDNRQSLSVIALQTRLVGAA